ncbi:hypothetical protein WD019_21110 [Fictibacillus sp. Mic-4]|uniref:hypothetical protein n=1 Tax=Fictibacillus sp. Mic-4 TaxID=3132826 RepID=UPI003CF682EF
MHLSVPWMIVLGVLFLFIQYVIIETAVRRGIDASKTYELLEEILETLKGKDRK